ncbi:MAG TPA: AraC family transcriptional regulator [Flavobacteriaceae bacterium]|nr:AraC family transcriptional regulator [Flavobacteriaceae bacterium]
MIFAVLNIILLISGIQGILFTIIILSSKRFKERSNFYLALLILSFSIGNLQNYFWNSGLITEELFYGVIYIPYGYIDVVFFYFYIKTFLFPNRPIQPKEKWLYFPFAIAFFLTLYFKIGHSFQFLSGSDFLFIEKLEVINDFFSLIFAIILLLICNSFIIEYEKQQASDQSNTFKIDLRWLKTLFFLMLLALFFWVIAFIEEIIWDANNSLFYYFLYVSISIIIYILGHVGLYKVGVLKERKKIRKFYADRSNEITIESPPSKNKHIIAFEQYIKEEKNYLNNQLSLDMVAEEIGINKSYLSRLINAELEVNFSCYVNQLRVEEMKTYINNPDFNNYTLTAMGLESGFNSKSSFNKAFKKHTGLSPSAYRKTKGRVFEKEIS